MKRVMLAAVLAAAIGVGAAVAAVQVGPAGATGAIAPCSPGNIMLHAATHRLVTLPGVTITRYHKAGRNDVDVTRADLRRTRLSPRTAPSVAQRTYVGQQVAGTNALVAVNGDFFWWGSNNAATGPEVKGPGVVRKGSAHPAHKSLIFGNDRRGRIDYASVSIVVHHGTRSVQVGALNEGKVVVNGVGVYTPSWGSTSLTKLGHPAGIEREYLVNSNGYITQVLPYLSKTLIPRGGKILVAHGTGWRHLAGIGAVKGQRVTLTWGKVQSNVYSAIGVRTDLIRQWSSGDRYETRLGCVQDPAVARQIVGLSRDKRTLFLVTVHGRADGIVRGSGGMSVQQEQGFMWALGAYAAANLDGGGSTVLKARVGGAWRTEYAVAGSERPVPNSLVIWPG